MSSPYNDLNETEKISSFEDIDLSLNYSYANYLHWLFDDRVELIDGKVFKMSPAPSSIHQEISVRISSSLHNYLIDKPCKIYYAPFDVRFPNESIADKDIYTVLQPDICVICDTSKIDGPGCIGAPDIVVEILSPGNNKTELVNKYKVYEEFGVKEYWVVNPEERTLLKYLLDGEGQYYASRCFTVGDKIYSEVLPDFAMDLDEVFKD